MSFVSPSCGVACDTPAHHRTSFVVVYKDKRKKPDKRWEFSHTLSGRAELHRNADEDAHRQERFLIAAGPIMLGKMSNLSEPALSGEA